MFMGEYNHIIDAKGRLIIPARFRELLGEEFILTKGLDGCLSIYPMDAWEAFETKLRALPLTNKNARTFTRFFVAGATNCELDRQGRILVPQTLREFAGLEKDDHLFVDESHYQNFYEFPIKSLNYLVIICFDL